MISFSSLYLNPFNTWIYFCKFTPRYPASFLSLANISFIFSRLPFFLSHFDLLPRQDLGFLMARSPEHPNFALPSHPFMDSFDQQSGDSPSLHLVYLKMVTSAVLPRGLTPESLSPPVICISSGEFSSDPLEFSSEAVGVQFKSWLRGFSGPILPPPFMMLHDEGYTFRE